MYPRINSTNIPFITRDQMVEVDRLMVEHYGISLLQMMENAGRDLAQLCIQYFHPKKSDLPIVVLVGKGGNGGGVLVAARHLRNAGYKVIAAITVPPEKFKDVTLQQLKILVQMGIPVYTTPEKLPNQAGLILDGLIGYSLRGNPSQMAAELIIWANNNPAPTVSMDIPSGVLADSGNCLTPCINTNIVMTLALPKNGLKKWQASSNKKRLFVADISIPPVLYQNAFKIRMPSLFHRGPLVEITLLTT